MIQILPVRISSDIEPNDDLASLIVSSAKDDGLEVLDRDIIVVAQKVVSKSEGRVVDLATITPSKKANDLARRHGKDPRLVELILRDSREVVRARNGVIITETLHGFVCANAGIDQSNVRRDSSAVLLPAEPDRSAARLRRDIKRLSAKDVAVIITDTFGRAFRNGQVNVAIGVAGIHPINSYVGRKDMYGKVLRVTEIAVADELASAAELVMGKADRTPAAIIRGYNYSKDARGNIVSLLRDKKRDLFR